MQIRPLVENADSLLKWSKKIFGSTIVNGIIRHTFFHQFCAGEPQNGRKSHTLPSLTMTQDAYKYGKQHL